MYEVYHSRKPTSEWIGDIPLLLEALKFEGKTVDDESIKITAFINGCGKWFRNRNCNESCGIEATIEA